MNHPTMTPQQMSQLMPGGAPPGHVPKFTPDFWKGQLQNRVPMGTVLSGILEDDLHSGRSKAGDVFSILLQDGFVLNGREVIPRHSKIIGHVMSAAPAKTMKHGHPGRLQVSLQTLVLPDGRNVPLHGFIDRNANHEPKEEPKKKNHGQSFSDYGQTFSSFLGQFTAGIGANMARRHRGMEFRLDKGEVVPVKLNRSLDIPQPLAPGQTAGSVVPGLVAPAPMAGAAPPWGAPAVQQPASAPVASAVPGLVGPDPEAPAGVPQVRQPAENPNAIFEQPIRPRPLVDLPDPF